ncbi:adhesion G protein-coupled receptor B3-like [Sitophilus oryzae]|uniref:Adhesion G protein-coupled receptor B3-like n=1 Tax=Sitophilus oryzae TaxID=7048 RepID=A0A6J2YG99_SITOR|nr:adhesion G protein-coupled receptor B3-like [Sitophilus oryzae]
MSGADVTFQVYCPKKDEKKVKNVLNKWIDRGHVGNVTVSEKDNSIKTALSIQSVDINQAGVIRENDEFILSCVARGSPTTTFRWFKDGLLMNLTYTRQKWIKLIKDPHVTDQYTALLAVERARRHDEGKFTCQVEDFNIQQCMSKFVRVRRRPAVRMEPMSLTVKKKDITYSCLVQDSTTSSEKVIHVYVLDREGVHTCPEESSYDLVWPETAPDTDYVQECPKDFSGIVVRKCSLRDGKKPAWEKPDFSQCTHRTLETVYDDFEQLKLGYAATSIDTLLKAIMEYVTITQRGNLRPGEGARILTIIEEILTFIGQVKINYFTTNQAASVIYRVIDQILSTPEALLRPQEINLLQKTLFSQLGLAEFQLGDDMGLRYFNLTLNTFMVTVFQQNPKQSTFQVPVLTKKLSDEESWISAKLTLHRTTKRLELFGCVIYKNISAFFPPKSFLRTKDGTEIQYQIYSQITALAPILRNSTGSDQADVTVDFSHFPDFPEDDVSSGGGKWEVKCGYAPLDSLAQTWDVDKCEVKGQVRSEVTRCLCPGYGAYVLLLVMAQPEAKATPTEPHKFVLICSFLCCIFLTIFTTICLGLSFFFVKKSSLIILKLQCSFSLFLCEILFTIAILLEPPQKYYMIFLTFLEMFLLLSISSHLSKLLIVFTELIHVPKPVTSKYTVIGIISGVPLITIFGNHLAYKTMDISLKSWWMIENSLAFNIFVTVVSIVTALFIFIYLSVVKKLKELIASQEKHEKALNKRIALIRRSGCIFFVLLAFSVSSILYINNEKLMWSTYQFSAVNLIVGLVLTICYIIKSENGFKEICGKKRHVDDSFFNGDTGNPLQFMTKQETEIDSQSTIRRQDIQQISLKSMEPLKISASRTQSISNAFESCLQSSSNFCDVSLKETSTLPRDKSQHQIEPYNSSPPTFRKLQTNNSFSQSPDILSQKVCVELDLVASSICSSKPEKETTKDVKTTTPKVEKKSEHKTVRIMFPPKVIITPDDAISRILESDNNSSERTQPDGHDDIIPSIETVSEVSRSPSSPQHSPSYSEDNLDGVLDSISHDLDYLLNRSDEFDSNVKPSTLSRKVSKPPGASVVNQIPEELIKDESTSGPEGIMLRTNC